METTGETKKLRIYSINDFVDYKPGTVVFKNILSKTSGNINILAIDAGVALPPKTIQFDTFIFIAEGTAQLVIDSKPYSLSTGRFIIIPAHASNESKAGIGFKMISAIIKSGYEEV